MVFQSAHAQTSVHLGIIPYLSPRNLVKTYTPMKEYLENSLGRRVEIYSSGNFRQFQSDACRNDFDIVITAAHFARILQQKYRFKPLLKFADHGRALIVTSAIHPLSGLEALHHQTIAVPDKLSLAAIVTLSYLKNQGLDSASDFTLMLVPSFASAILAVQKGEAAAAITAGGVLEKMPADVRQAVTVLADAGNYPNPVMLAAPGTDNRNVRIIRSAMLKIGSNESLYDKVLEPVGLGRFTPATPRDMSRLDAYLPLTRQILDGRI